MSDTQNRENHTDVATLSLHVVVVAPPATLGVLRKAFHPEVQARIISEFPKDLSGHAIADIERHLAYSD